MRLWLFTQFWLYLTTLRITMGRAVARTSLLRNRPPPPRRRTLKRLARAPRTSFTCNAQQRRCSSSCSSDCQVSSRKTGHGPGAGEVAWTGP